MRYKGLIVALLIIVALGISFLTGMVVYLLAGGTSGSGFLGGNVVGVVTVEGPIITSKKTIEHIEQFRKDDDVKSVVLRVDSPGGAVAASQEILEAVALLKKDKPVIVSMGTVAASGGYYISCSADKIFANEGTTTGSIGVRLEHVNIGDLMKWAMIDKETIKSGKLKNMFAINKPLSPEAKEILQGLVDEIHVQFKETVSRNRGIDMAELNKIADGRIFTGARAKELGLVDELGGFVKAVEKAGELGGIEGYPKIVYPKKDRSIVEMLFTEARVLLAEEKAGMTGQVQPMMMLHMSSQ